MKMKTIASVLFLAAFAAVADTGTEAKDQGPEIAAEAAAKSADLTSVEGTAFVSAEDQVNKNLEKLGLSAGYDRKRKSIIAIGTAYYTSKDPAKDEAFFRIRAMKARQAYLDAKAEIIRSIMTEFSAMDKAVTLSEEGDETTVAQFKQKKEEFAPKKDAFVQKLQELDKAEADALAAAPLDDTFGATMDTLAMKLSGWTVNEEVDQTKKDALNAILDGLKAQLAALQADWKALDAEAKAIAETPSSELNSSVTMLSKMPLLGAAVLSQTESWEANDGTYSVSMAVVWSRKLQESAKRLLAGDIAAGDKKGKFSAKEWIDQQDLTRMIGSRRFNDSDGHNIFVGIAARAIPVRASKINATKKIADTDAFRDVAFALFGDVEAFREASANLKEYAGDEQTDDKHKSTEKLNDVISQKIDKLQLSGVVRLKTQTAVHPITGKNAYFTAYYLEPELAKDALEILKKLYADSVTVTKASQYKAGVHAGAAEALNEARASKEEFNRGVKDGKADVKAAVDSEESKRAAKKLPGATGATGSDKAGQGKSKGGTFTGDNAVDTDF